LGEDLNVWPAIALVGTEGPAPQLRSFVVQQRTRAAPPTTATKFEMLVSAVAVISTITDEPVGIGRFVGDTSANLQRRRLRGLHSDHQLRELPSLRRRRSRWPGSSRCAGGQAGQDLSRHIGRRADGHEILREANAGPDFVCRQHGFIGTTAPATGGTLLAIRSADDGRPEGVEGRKG